MTTTEAMNEKPTVLFVAPGGLMPVVGGGSARMWGLLRWLRRSGYRVELVTENHPGYQDALENEVDRLWINRPPTLTLPAKMPMRERLMDIARRGRAWLSRARGQQERSVLERNRAPSLELLAAKAACESKPVATIVMYAWMAHALDLMPPGTLRMIDTIDVQHTRAARALSAGGDLSHIQCTREDEITELTRADVLLAIQPEEAAELSAMCPDIRVVTLLHAFDVPESQPDTVQEATLLYVGNLYDPNVIGIRSFLSEVWPTVRAAHPQALLTVCGKVCQAISNPPEGVILAGCVPDLAPYYRQAAIVINPVPYGSGLKIKTVEALAEGKCLVCTEEAIRGLGSPEEVPVVVAGLKQGMSDRIMELLEDATQRRNLERRAWEYAKAHLRGDVVYAPLAHLLAEHAQRGGHDLPGRNRAECDA